MPIEKNNKPLDAKEILILYHQKKSEIQQALESFRNVKADELFYELCYCLLTPASKAQNAIIVVNYLKKAKFFEEGFDPTDVLRGKAPFGIPYKVYIRFHNQKAKRLLLARENWNGIEEILEENMDVQQKRDRLVEKVFGFGYKEASHFLRNIGYQGIAILDRHILRNLVDFGYLEKIPIIGNRKNYLIVEKVFFEFANKLNIPPEELDLLLWAKETGEVLK